jgi:hypothetical protein
MDAHRILQKARYHNIIKRYIIAISTMFFQHPMRVRKIVNNSPENENASYSLAVADDIAHEATTYQLSCNQALLLTEFASCLSPCPSPNRLYMLASVCISVSQMKIQDSNVSKSDIMANTRVK